jgi:hypothetical protein
MPLLGPGRALSGATATPVVLSRHVQTLAFIGFRHIAHRWPGRPVIVLSASVVHTLGFSTKQA